MTTIRYSPKFLKNLKLRIHTPKLKEKFKERVRIFSIDPRDQILKDHALTGSKSEYRSFSVTGDLRIIYKNEGNIVLFYDIGTHNQVY